MYLVKIWGFTRKLNVIAFVKLIRDVTGESLAPAKQRVDELLDGSEFYMELPSPEAARQFVADAAAIGALTRFDELP